MNYQERKQNRIERYQELAEKNRELSSNIHEAAHKMASVIPFGQPILIGHHSEKSDRAYRGKIERKFKKSFEVLGKAKYYEQKAKAAENNNSISSDDPEAVVKLKEKIEKAEKLQEYMKKINAAYKKYIKNPEKFNFVDFTEKEQELLKTWKPRYSWITVPFESYELSNNNANIRRMKQRLEELQKKSNDKTSEIEINDIKILDNVEENRVQIFFPGIPSEEIRNQLKSNGFKWSRYNKAWQRMRSNHALYLAQKIVKGE